jgi:hypothetical protein
MTVDLSVRMQATELQKASHDLEDGELQRAKFSSPSAAANVTARNRTRTRYRSAWVSRLPAAESDQRLIGSSCFSQPATHQRRPSSHLASGWHATGRAGPAAGA